LHARFLAARRGKVRNGHLFDAAAHFRVEGRRQRLPDVRFTEYFEQTCRPDAFRCERAVELSDERVLRKRAALKVPNHVRKASHVFKAMQLPMV
jgi:hypothetical protein